VCRPIDVCDKHWQTVHWWCLSGPQSSHVRFCVSYACFAILNCMDCISWGFVSEELNDINLKILFSLEIAFQPIGSFITKTELKSLEFWFAKECFSLVLFNDRSYSLLWCFTYKKMDCLEGTWLHMSFLRKFLTANRKIRWILFMKVVGTGGSL